MAKWIKLKAPHVSMNAPNVHSRIPMTYTPVIPWDWSVHRMFTDKIPKGVRHLVFNCHGFLSRPNFDTPHLSLGTVIHPGNVSAFDLLYTIPELLVIWLSACNMGGSVKGLDFCKSMAIHSGCYVVTQTTGVPDISIPWGHVEDYHYAMPQYIDPAGDMVPRDEFLQMGDKLGFSRS